METKEHTKGHCCADCAMYANRCRCKMYGSIPETYARRRDNDCMGFTKKNDSKTSKPTENGKSNHN